MKEFTTEERLTKGQPGHRLGLGEIPVFHDSRIADHPRHGIYPVGGAAAAVAPRKAPPAHHRAAISKSKRAVDILGALGLLLFLLPLFALVAIAIRLDSSGPVFFRQRRTGLGGDLFFILKFRSMTVCEDGGQIKQVSAGGDSRVTRVGAFLRKSSIDELPQLINVLRGDMSLVGPRPHALAHDQMYGRLLPSYGRRFAVRPGITGLAQVRSLRGETRTPRCMANRIAADIEYIATWSFKRDVVILIRSALIVFGAGGR